MVGSCKGLLSECLSRHRSDTVAAANALGLKVRRLVMRLHGIVLYESDCSGGAVGGQGPALARHTDCCVRKFCSSSYLIASGEDGALLCRASPSWRS